MQSNLLDCIYKKKEKKKSRQAPRALSTSAIPTEPQQILYMIMLKYNRVPVFSFLS